MLINFDVYIYVYIFFFNLVCIHKVLLLLNRVQIIDFWGPCGGGGVAFVLFSLALAESAREILLRLGKLSTRFCIFVFLSKSKVLYYIHVT